MIFAIRNRWNPKVFFHLPRRSTGQVKGLTKIERFEAGRVPRLFARRRHAEIALMSWVNAGPEYITAMRAGEVNKVRYIGDWEIIPVELKEVTSNDEAQSQTAA